MIKISSNRRYLVHEDGSPFFYLADTAWELFHRPTLNDAKLYLQDRAAKKFTVIQAVLLAEFEGVTTPNANGDLPLVNQDPDQPNEAYFAHVDRVIAIAESLGLVIGLLPTWGDKWNVRWGAGPMVFTPEKAYRYGKYVGARYRDKPVIWILGGDRPIDNDEHRRVIDEMARGVREGDSGCHLMTFHPPGGKSSSLYVHDAAWLDFHMLQTGHRRNSPNYDAVTEDYQRSPVRPCLDGEPGYEDHPSEFDLEKGYLDDYDVRKAAYWSVFAGAFGHTYGCHPIWAFWTDGWPPVNFMRTPWQQALHLPGAGQMRHLRALIESRPFLTRIPDQQLLATDPGTGTHHIRATRDESGSYAFLYVPSVRPFKVDLEKLSGIELAVHWYNPRTGTANYAGKIPRQGHHEFTPPNSWPDWVLTLDDSAKNYPAPGV